MAERVSIVVTTYYRNDTLTDAIESALGQTHDPVEVVVVDDSGERHAAPVAEQYDVAYVAHDRNEGQAAALQTGLELTSGAYVQFLDDDDWLDERKIGSQVELLRGRPETNVAYCGIETDDGRIVAPSPDRCGDVLEHVLTFDNQPIITSTLLVERELLERIAPIPAYDVGTDLPLQIELARRTNFDFVDEPLVFRREGSSSKGVSVAATDARWRLLEEYEDLYADLPDDVRRRAVANAARFQGLVYLRHSTWSWRAIASFWREVRANEDTDLRAVGRLLASVFGSPGVHASRAVVERVQGPNRGS